MYWDGAYDVLYKSFGERRPTAKKEHTCCEHEEPKIVVGEKYLYISGMWRSETRYDGQYFKAYKMCLGCETDWNTVLEIFHENREEDACIVYGNLKEAVWDALDCGFIDGTHPLIQKWYPDEYRAVLVRAGESKEEVAWKEIEKAAIRNGQQPTMFPNVR